VRASGGFASGTRPGAHRKLRNRLSPRSTGRRSWYSISTRLVPNAGIGTTLAVKIEERRASSASRSPHLKKAWIERLCADVVIDFFGPLAFENHAGDTRGVVPDRENRRSPLCRAGVEKRSCLQAARRCGSRRSG